jgi:hypothetical protein
MGLAQHTDSITTGTVVSDESTARVSFPQPRDVNGIREALVSYALIGLRDEWESLAQREAEIESQLRQLETHPWTRTKLRGLIVSDTARYLRDEREKLIQRRAELIDQWQALQARATASRILIEPSGAATHDEDAHLSAAFKAVLGGMAVGIPVGGFAGLGLMALVMSATMGWLLVGVYVGVALGTILGGAAGGYAHTLSSAQRSQAIPLLEATS